VTLYAANCNINTEPFWDNNITSGWNAQAQTFEAPSANCNVLSSWEFKLAAGGSQVTFNIYQWGSSGPIGSALYSQTFNWGDTIDVNNINLLLTPGQLYGAELDFHGYNGPSVYFNFNQTGYPGFDGWWDMSNEAWQDVPGTNQYFMANFTSGVPEPGSFLLFGSSLLGIAGVLRRRIGL
jgi:hypothetical protein